MADVKVAEKLCSDGVSLTKLISNRKVELSSENPRILLLSNLRFPDMQRRKLVEQELEKARKEIPEYKRRSAAAEEAKTKVTKELDSTKRLLEELKLNLEMAQTEETQAKHDSELAMLRLVELEQGVGDDASVAAKAQLEVAEARHVAAVSELKSVNAEMEILRKEYDSLVREKDVAEAAMAASEEAEKTMEELNFELIAAQELLESSDTYRLEDSLNWEELKEANEEIQRLNRPVMSAKDLKSKLNSASSLLLDLRNELDSYMELKLNEKLEEEDEEMETKTREETQSAIALAKKELEEEKVNIEKAITTLNCLKIAAMTLRSELETEKSALSAVREREEMASLAVSALDAEVENTFLELALIQMKEREARERKSELPELLQLLATEAEKSKSSAQAAHEEMQREKEEAEQAKAAVRTIETRLIAAQKEIEASKASERLARAAIKALKESENTRATSTDCTVTLPLEAYHELSKNAREAEELAHIRLCASISQIKLAKESESKSFEKLEEFNREIKEALKTAKEKAEKAEEGEMGVEPELRKWRAELELMRKANESHRKATETPTIIFARKDSTKSDQAYYFPGSHVVSQKLHLCAIIGRKNSLSEGMMGKRTRNSFLRRILVFLARRKQHSYAGVL